MGRVSEAQINEAIANFDYEGKLLSKEPFGSGHINDTYRLTYETSQGTKRYILQRMSRNIFKKPVELMENISGVTSWLRKKIIENGGDPERETLTLVKSQTGLLYFVDSDGEYWRVYLFIEGATCYDAVKDDNDFYQSAVAFGHFQQLLADYPAETLHETIKDFHNTPDRLKKFKKAVAEDVCGRAASVQKEIDFILEREELTHALYDMQLDGRLPLRVTHNDTKLNNILFDKTTGEGLCVIDLDTVMPGLAANDFGDSIRFGANHCAEDEADLSKVNFSMELFEIYTKGFLQAAGEAFTPLEKQTLPWGAKLMTMECGMRFLADYLEGDHYFHINYETQNLNRARTQFKLTADMERNWDAMQKVIEKYC